MEGMYKRSNHGRTTRTEENTEPAENGFSNEGRLPQNEPKQLEAWHGGNIYERILDTRKGKPLFVLHDGPPYPTGEIHLGPV